MRSDLTSQKAADPIDAWVAHAVPDAHLDGVANISVFREDSLIYIHDLSVEDDRQGQGVGRRVIELLLADARASGITRVEIDSVLSAEEFWEARGFRRDDSRRLEDEMDGIPMALQLQAGPSSSCRPPPSAAPEGHC